MRHRYRWSWTRRRVRRFLSQTGSQVCRLRVNNESETLRCLYLIMLLSTSVVSCPLFIMIRYLVFMDYKISSPSFRGVFVLPVLEHSVLDMVKSGTPRTVFETWGCGRRESKSFSSRAWRAPLLPFHQTVVKIFMVPLLVYLVIVHGPSPFVILWYGLVKILPHFWSFINQEFMLDA